MNYNLNNISKEEIKLHMKNIGGIMLKYLKVTAVDSLIIAVANLIFMLIMKMPCNILISIVVGITNIIPNFGALLGALFGGVILLLHDPKMAMWFLIFTVLLQFVDGFFIKPRLFGKSFGMSSIVMCIVLLIGGGIFGVAGMIFSVPLVVIIQYIYRNIYLQHRTRDDFLEGNSDE